MGKRGQGGGADDLTDETLLEGDDALDLEHGLGEDALDLGTDTDLPADDKGKKQEGEDELEIEIEADADTPVGDEDAGALDGAERTDDNYSKAVQARIERERRIARDARARAESERTARLAAETRSRAVQKDALDITASALESQIKSTRTALIKAKEDGNSEQEVDLQTTLSSLTTKQANVEAAKENLKAEDEKAKRGADSNAPNPLADQWKQRNPWFGNAKYAEATAVTAAIDQALSREGYDKNSAEYFAELDRRVRRRVPEVQRFARRQQQQSNGERPRSPVGPARRSDGEQRPKSGKVTLGRGDFALMRQYGMDPSDKAQQREYARQKLNGGGNG